MLFRLSHRPRAIAALLPLACSILVGQTACGGGSTWSTPPSHLAYPAHSATYVMGVEIKPNTPTHDGGDIATYRVWPPLPPGLQLNPFTGVISGTPRVVRSQSTYTVTAWNKGGSTDESLVVTVLRGAATPSTLVNGRFFHTATLLQDDQVLFTGGLGDMGPSASAELFDSATGTFTLTGSMAAPRFIHAAAGLRDGSVLVLGGTDGAQVLGSTELYNPSSGIFLSNASMLSPRLYFTATVLKSGKVLIVGGYPDFMSGPVATAELFDPATGTFTFTGSLHNARAGQSATLLENGKVLIAGGFDLNHDLMTSAELYDPATGTFSNTGSMGNARGSQSATLLSNGKVLVAGGFGQPYPAVIASAELYDPAKGTFSSTGDLITARESHWGTLLPDGRVLINGGDDGASPFASLELYNPKTGTFTAAGSFPNARTNDTATLLPSGMVLSAGGFDGGPTVYNSADLFDPSTIAIQHAHGSCGSPINQPERYLRPLQERRKH